MKIEDHEKSYNEHRSNLKRLIEEGIENNQRNISYNISHGSVELFSIFLHKLHLIFAFAIRGDRPIQRVL